MVFVDQEMRKRIMKEDWSMRSAVDAQGMSGEESMPIQFVTLQLATLQLITL
jgi:hypothetical protein